ncbi:hypothetical protein [Herbidospora cretacea]|uniref:hypothetical protein n=1 Tax=Herbidospora cretacea TaxID=28444 RepID=UPI0004C41E1D|nr:hypothetical protein [Herbidospora cretacea]
MTVSHHGDRSSTWISVTAALIFVLCALGGPILELFLVDRVQAECLGDLSSEEKFADLIWLVKRVAVFGALAIVWPVVAIVAGLVADRLRWGYFTPRGVVLAVLVLALVSVAFAIRHDIGTVECP